MHAHHQCKLSLGRTTLSYLMQAPLTVMFPMIQSAMDPMQTNMPFDADDYDIDDY